MAEPQSTEKREQSLLNIVCYVGAGLFLALVAYNLFAAGAVISTDGLFFTVVPLLLALCFLVVPAMDMLARLKLIEREFGRRPGKRWGSRVLDLDLVAWSGGRVAVRRLAIPHPRLDERDFVIGPLAAIAPGWKIKRGLSTRHLASRLGKRRPAS